MKTETIFELRERICKGCNSAADNNKCTICIEPINDREETCPCSSCLVKMICNESCLEFRDYCRNVKIKENF
jgi:hypothetical protein